MCCTTLEDCKVVLRVAGNGNVEVCESIVRVALCQVGFGEGDEGGDGCISWDVGGRERVEETGLQHKGSENSKGIRPDDHLGELLKVLSWICIGQEWELNKRKRLSCGCSALWKSGQIDMWLSVSTHRQGDDSHENLPPCHFICRIVHHSQFSKFEISKLL